MASLTSAFAETAVYRSMNNTMLGVCSTSASSLAGTCVGKPRRGGRAAPIPGRTVNGGARQELFLPRQCRSQAAWAASVATVASTPSLRHAAHGTSRPVRGLRSSVSASGDPARPTRRTVRSAAPTQTASAPEREGSSSSGSSHDEGPVAEPAAALFAAQAPARENGANGSHADGGNGSPSAAGVSSLYADLEDAVPYRNGRNGAAASSVAAAGNGHAAAVADPHSAGGLAGDMADQVCVVDVGPDGDTTTLCVPVVAMPTVASVMQASADPAAAVAAANGAAAAASNGVGSDATGGGIAPPPPRTAPSVVDAAIAVSLRPAGFIRPDALASGADLSSDIRSASGDFPFSASAGISLPATATHDGGEVAAAGGGGGGGPADLSAAGSGSVDQADTPEGLTDVEVSSVAPVADWLRNQDDITTLTYAVLTGGLVAAAVFVFDVSIQTIHDLPDIFSSGFGIGGGRKTGLEFLGAAVPFRCVMPVAAGFAVAWLQDIGFSPALKVLTRAMEGVTDDSTQAALPKSYWQVARKGLASAITLGSGASLGPEAPSVELGANTAAFIAPKGLSKRRQRMLIAAGAAAGVSAAFDAPVSGALFAVEFVLKSSRLGLDRLSTSTVFVSTSVAAGVIGFLRAQGQALGVAGAGTHLVGRIPYFSIQPNLLVDVAQFSALGLGCAVAAVALYESVRVCEIALRPLPRWLSAPTAGVLCGVIAYRFPQVQYGYVNLEEIFRDSTGMSAADLSALLTAKIAATAVCVGGGLVGGLFAPSLFLGALVGDVMGHFVAEPWGLPDPTSLIVVGAAAVLGAACRAPLTAVALMVEITRDTGLLVPLLSAIGVSSVFTDYLEGAFSRRLEQALVELYLREKAFFWAASLVAPPGAGSGSGSGSDSREEPHKTVEDVLGTRARLYVRHTLPLAQAKAAMAAAASSAAVVVDDNFSPLGVVYAEDVEAELIRQRLLNEPDANFNRQ